MAPFCKAVLVLAISVASRALRRRDPARYAFDVRAVVAAAPTETIWGAGGVDAEEELGAVV